MKTGYLLLIALMLSAFGCSENVLPAAEAEPIQGAKKKAKVSKTVTIPVHGQVTTFPDYTKPLLSCLPVEFEVNVASEGTCTGHSTMTGTFVQEESTFETHQCNIEIIDGMPVIHAVSDVIITGNRGDKKFVKSYLWINVVTNVVTGYNELNDGTERFKGLSGRSDIIEGRFNPETGSVSWKEKGFMEKVVRD